MTETIRTYEELSVPEHVEVLLGNRAALAQKLGKDPKEILYTPPSGEAHYPHLYLWDSCFAGIVYAREGYTGEAITEIFSILNGMDEHGFTANMIFAAKGRAWDPERPSFMEPDVSSNYTQPPVIAQAVQETYNAMKEQGDPNAELFLSETYPLLKKFYGYFEKHRQNSKDDPMVGVIHPHETGRDSDPTFDFFKSNPLTGKLFKWKGKNTNKMVAKIKAGEDYASVMALNYKHRTDKWDLSKARETFWVNDLMFNCIYVDNLNEMAKLASELRNSDDSDHYQQLANKVESQILDKPWFPQAREGQGLFYNLNKGQPIEEVSVNNLFPLLLPNLRVQQLESIMTLLETSFNTDFPIPSVATDSPSYDADNLMTQRLWRGGTWMNTNWYLVEHGLRRQAARPELVQHPELLARCRAFANKVALASNKMVDQGYYEFYNPETGKPQRAGTVTNFAWSTLARLLKVEKT